MAVGLGPHRCLGSHHARMMFQVMLGQILTRLPDFEISGPVERFHDAGDVYAIRHHAPSRAKVDGMRLELAGTLAELSASRPPTPAPSPGATPGAC